jgi:hypothetical protein
VHDRQGQAAVDPPAFNDHGASAALALVATLFASGEAQVFAEGIEKRRAWVELERVVLAVDMQTYGMQARLVARRWRPMDSPGRGRRWRILSGCRNRPLPLCRLLFKTMSPPANV